MGPELLEHILDGREKPTDLPFSLLSNITENFSKEREIGKGGFATVYKGVLPNRNVAVKRIMNCHTIDDAPFLREVDCLMAVNHQNIVQFVGYCASTDLTATPREGSKAHIFAERRERLLCFEYIDNGNLQKHITDELSGLEWNARYEIIKGICNGLDYLLNEKHIYHMDLKPANVLLDRNMVPKITDFGQSRYDEKSQTISINRFGTPGYCPPEYALSGERSPKSDMYSLGIIIIELVTGQKDIQNNNKINVLRRWQHRWRKTGKESPLSYQQVTKCIDIGLICQEIDPCNRPLIRQIVRDINEMECTSSQTSNENESTVGQISPYSDGGMLGIEPLEPHFPLEPNKDMSCPLELTNETDSYCTEPQEGIVPPRSKGGVDITLQPQEEAPQRANEFTVRSTKVNNRFTESEGIVPEVTPGSSMLLDVHPFELCFRFEPNKLIACSLDLTNNTDEQVVFGLLKKSDEQRCFLRSLPLFGIVDPWTIYTLVVIINEHENLPREKNVDLILQTTTFYGILNDGDECIQHFHNAQELGNTVHKVTLKGVCALQGEMVFEHSIPRSIKIILMEKATDICSMDANQTEPLIITGHLYGYVHIWNYDTQILMGSIKIPTETRASSVKFIAHKGWFLVGSGDGFIHVYNYKKRMQKIKSIRAHNRYVSSLAIHPTQPYVLSACPTKIMLWGCGHNWLGWKCMQTYEKDLDYVNAVAFIPEDANSFAAVCHDGTVKVWSLDSPESKYTLSGHSGTRDAQSWGLHCLDFFTCDGRLHLITGSDGKTAKIWDMQKKECVHTLPHRSRVFSALSHNKRPLLVTSTADGDVYLWSAITFRLKRLIHFDSRLRVSKFMACLTESGRVVVAHAKAVSVIEISDEQGLGTSNGNDENSISATD